MKLSVIMEVDVVKGQGEMMGTGQRLEVRVKQDSDLGLSILKY